MAASMVQGWGDGPANKNVAVGRDTTGEIIRIIANIYLTDEETEAQRV